MQDLNPLFIVKLGAVPPPILATIALMAELNHVHHPERGEQPADDCVDIEQPLKRTRKWGHYNTSKK
jgi:hypothetical protein